jgi:2-deoxy-D-gluconate 3-dehydrogenase
MSNHSFLVDTFGLAGQTAVVTGCKRGIGRAIALALAQAGADVIGVSATLEPDGGDIGRDVTALGRRFSGYACDLGARPALYSLIEALRRDVPTIDVLINNAGTILRRPAADHSDGDWDRVIEVNLTAQFVLAREIGKQMLARGRGRIVFVASLLAFQGGINVPSYSASKGGIAQLTKAFANEWAAKGIGVNAIAPGYIRSDNTKPLWDDPDRNRRILERIPAGRWGDPRDVAAAAVFLSAAAAEYIHGTVLTVDGGWMAY